MLNPPPGIGSHLVGYRVHEGKPGFKPLPYLFGIRPKLLVHALQRITLSTVVNTWSCSSDCCV